MRCRIQRAAVIRPSQPSFCTPGKPPRNLSVTSLPSPSLRKLRPARCSCSLRGMRAVLPDELELHRLGIVNLAEIVANARGLEPVAFAVDHAPPGQVVDRGAPQHRLLAARIHRDGAAGAGRSGGSGIPRKYQAAVLGELTDAAGHDARAAQHRGYFMLEPRQSLRLDATEGLAFLGVDDWRQWRER